MAPYRHNVANTWCFILLHGSMRTVYFYFGVIKYIFYFYFGIGIIFC
ncbi:hypothetical protein Lp19_1176 [Lactiplantibacillus plantarum]|uniref:Uncharacterized protein n=1 Tax=Lactiplantibacillus plantarum TaxID=1590 RepID=A0A165RVA4_LACPN|nr:hypothetical protein Lp19_1176 [Lactiplantibacillus plantarum]